jgi:cytochrome bd-type quinol oxidase subunit 2
MNQSEFYGVVSAINFTLLGLWWVAIKDRADLGGHDHASRRMAYFVSLQFVIPATVSLLAQVAPSIPEVWRFAFTFAGITGGIGVALLADELRRSTDARVVPLLFAAVGIPAYALVAIVAIAPHLIGEMGWVLKPIEVEGILLSLLAFLGVQEAWFVAMSPQKAKS